MRLAYEYLGPLLKSNSSTASEIEMMSSKIPAVDRSSIYGPWTLVEFANFSSTGSKVVWTGTQSGRLIYVEPDIVSVAINRFGQNPGGSTIELNSFYSGRFEWRDQTTIVHIVQQSSDTSRIGQRQVRTIKINGDILELSGKGLTGDVLLTWKRG